MSFVSVRMTEEEMQKVSKLEERYSRLLGSKPKRHWILKHLIAKGFEAIEKKGVNNIDEKGI